MSSVTDTANPFRSFTHDARGNTTNDGRYTLVYDLGEQPVSLTGAGVSAAYTYDGNKKRVKSIVNGETTYSVYSALSGSIIFKDDVTGAKTTEYFGIGPAGVRIENGSTAIYTHKDHLGSPVASTDAGGALLWREYYYPYGEKWFDPAGNRDDAGYTGHIQDSVTGLTYMQARYFDPIIGRFYSPDPIDYQDQLNLYAYVHNDPVNNTDPTGLLCVPCIGAGIGFAAEAIAIGVDVVNGKNVGVLEGAARLGASTALGAVGGGAAGTLAKGVTQVAARSTASAATKATASVATKTVGNAAVGGAANGTNTAVRREIQIGLTDSSDITNSDIRGDIALGAAGAAFGTLGGEAIEGIARLSGPTDDVGRVGVIGAQLFDAGANIATVNPGAFGIGSPESPGAAAASGSACAAGEVGEGAC